MPQLEVLRPRPDLKEAPASFFFPGAPTPDKAADGRSASPSPEHIAMTPDAFAYPGGHMPQKM